VSARSGLPPGWQPQTTLGDPALDPTLRVIPAGSWRAGARCLRLNASPRGREAFRRTSDRWEGRGRGGLRMPATGLTAGAAFLATPAFMLTVMTPAVIVQPSILIVGYVIIGGPMAAWAFFGSRAMLDRWIARRASVPDVILSDGRWAGASINAAYARLDPETQERRLPTVTEAQRALSTWRRHQPANHAELFVAVRQLDKDLARLGEAVPQNPARAEALGVRALDRRRALQRCSRPETWLPCAAVAIGVAIGLTWALRSMIADQIWPAALVPMTGSGAHHPFDLHQPGSPIAIAVLAVALLLLFLPIWRPRGRILLGLTGAVFLILWTLGGGMVVSHGGSPRIEPAHSTLWALDLHPHRVTLRGGQTHAGYVEPGDYISGPGDIRGTVLLAPVKHFVRYSYPGYSSSSESNGPAIIVSTAEYAALRG
jgi:hypothetical protein